MFTFKLRMHTNTCTYFILTCLCFCTLTYTSHALIRKHTHIVLDWSHTSITLLLTGSTKHGSSPILLLHVLQSQAPHEVHVSLWHETYHKQRLRFIAAAGNLPRLLQWIHRERWGEKNTSNTESNESYSQLTKVCKGDDYLSAYLCIMIPDNYTKVFNSTMF